MTEESPPLVITDLAEELLLAILDANTSHGRKLLSAYDLGCVERVCCRFHQPAIFEDADGQALSLSERVAQRRVARALAAPIRPDGLRPFRPYERCDGENHKRVLQLQESGLLTRGVLHNVPVAAVERSGWKLAYAAPYSHRTRDADLDKVPPDARYVLVAAVQRPRQASGWQGTSSLRAGLERMRAGIASMHSGTAAESPERESVADPAVPAASSAAYALLAWGKRENVLRVTHGVDFQGWSTSTSNEEESVYWYRWPDHSFGFSSHPQLHLWAADAGIRLTGDEEQSEDRLSWNLDIISTGGWRAGKVVDLGSSSAWEKHLYYR